MERSAAPSRAISPVDRAFQVLQVVVAADEPLGVREIGRRTGLPRSTVSRLVGTLEDLGMVGRTANALVAPGSALATLQPRSVNTPMLLGDQLRPLLNELTTAFDENAALAIDDTDAALFVGQMASENPVSVEDVAGERHPFHLVAPGILLMASWPSERLDAFLAEPLEPATEFSVTDPQEVRKRLAKVQRDGFVWTNQELDVGINALAVGIYVADEVTAAMTLYGPSYRLSPTERPTLAADLGRLVATRSESLIPSDSQ